MKICKVSGCDNKHDCHGYCSKHNSQIVKYGKIIEKTVFDPNEIINCGDYYEIILRDKQCKEIARTLVDKDDIEKIKQYKWGLCHGYVRTVIKNKTLYLHHLILLRKKGFDTDHINHNKLDNRKCNLRYATRSQNNMNKITRGISWDKPSNKWQAYITINRKKIHLGLFIKEQCALKARRKGELRYFGEFAHKNI